MTDGEDSDSIIRTESDSANNASSRSYKTIISFCSQHRSARMEETSMNEIISNKQSILEIDFDRTFWNELGSLTFRRFGMSK